MQILEGRRDHFTSCIILASILKVLWLDVNLTTTVFFLNVKFIQLMTFKLHCNLSSSVHTDHNKTVKIRCGKLKEIKPHTAEMATWRCVIEGQKIKIVFITAGRLLHASSSLPPSIRRTGKDMKEVLRILSLFDSKKWKLEVWWPSFKEIA